MTNDDKLAWQRVAPASALDPHGKTLARVGELQIAIFRHEDALFGLLDSCPHSGASLCVGRVEDGHVRCPAHGLRFRLADGLLAGSAAGSQGTSLGVRVFPVRVMGEELQVQIESSAAAA